MIRRVGGLAGCRSCVNGTAALHLAMVELGIGPGDEVIVPALTFVATANAVRYVAATPVFADVDPMTYGVSAETIATLLSPATGAILVVHLYGHPVDIDPIGALAEEARDRAGRKIATECLGARYRGQLCGTLGDIGCFSFNGDEVISYRRRRNAAGSAAGKGSRTSGTSA